MQVNGIWTENRPGQKQTTVSTDEHRAEVTAKDGGKNPYMSLRDS